ncbi:MAG: hypothetical protein GQ525_09670 [Draconibacterium sp.]|nr:hypothetical protein [Draconibacterium sp.]
MKSKILKLSTVILLFISISAGCKENDLNKDYILLKNVNAIVKNNDYQNNISDFKLIWSLEVTDDKEALNLTYKYLVPIVLNEDYQSKGIKVLISGKVFIDQLRPISKSTPGVKLAPGYLFEITSIKKTN